ncbi:protein FAR1-RELATED SEQUENCE 5-like [Arachis hypogaea]|uniref:protein FAR1-RELATED SEQUENCE 5-like n=1 Tax=Arachis hypogaea TaxID=3818 RepID=UPI000DEC1478|nr:protein FAR1-RELATED SEQUENCE 5-like [Arachis hypogaea]
MDVNSEPLNSQDNVEDCLMTGVEENVNCTCDCGGSSSKCVGFEVRKGDTARGKDGTQRRRQFFCNKEGKIADKYISNSNRKKEHKVLTRMGCEAMLAVYFDTKISAWRVKKLVEKHNHNLVPRCFVHLILNHRGMNEAQKTQANTMHNNGLPTSKIMGLMVGQARGYANVGFTKNDLDNHIERTHRAKLIGGDSKATISYLLGKADVDPMAMARYSATDKSRLANLFWADGICRTDYQCFGDVLAFDTTYQKNKHRRPLVIFSDVILNKSPSVVVTDGDEAMKAEVQEIFLNATHQLCGWHIQNNVTANIKSKSFFDDFRRCLYAPWHPDEFEEYWENMIKNMGLRKMNGCEGINNFIKRFIGIRQSLLELVQNLEHALRDYKHNGLGSQFKMVYGEPVLTTHLAALELCATNFYTREMFGKVKTEIEEVVALDVINEENISTTIVLKVKECDRGQHIYTVLYERNTKIWSVNDVKKYLDERSAGSTVQDREREFLMHYGALSVAATWMKNCPVRNEGNNLDDKTGGGTQASFGAEKELLKDPMASQGTSVVPNIEVNASVQLGFRLGDSELINGHGVLSHHMEVVQQGQYPKFNGMQSHGLV